MQKQIMYRTGNMDAMELTVKFRVLKTCGTED
jgi:hypothetical protein